MEEKSLKHRLLVTVFFVLFLLLAAGYFSFAFLPRYIEHKFLPALGRQMSTSLTGKVFSVGLSSADVGDVVLGDRQRPGLMVGHLHAAYSLPDLLDKKLSQLTISGLRINAEVSANRLTIPGLNPVNPGSETVTPKNHDPPQSVTLPLLVERLLVQNSMAVIQYQDQSILIPFSLEILAEPESDKADSVVYRVDLRLQPQGDSIAVTGNIDLAANSADFLLTADALNLDKFLPLAGLKSDPLGLDKSSVSGGARIRLQPFQLLEATLAADPGPMQISGLPFRFDDAGTINDRQPGITFELKSLNGEQHLQARAMLSEPLAALLAVRSTLSPDAGGLHAKGSIVFNPNMSRSAEMLNKTLLVKKIPELHGDFTFDLDRDKTWRATVKNSVSESGETQAHTLDVLYKGITMQGGTPDFELQGSGNSREDSLNLSILLPELQVEASDAKITVFRQKLLATYTRARKQEKAERLTLKLTLPETHISGKKFTGQADIVLGAEIQEQKAGESIQAAGSLGINNAELRGSDHNLAISGISGEIPWNWPGSAGTESGKLHIADMHFKNFSLGNFRADLTLQQQTYLFNGTYISNLLPGLITSIDGQAEISGSGLLAELTARTPPVTLSSIHLGKFDPALQNTYFSGMVGLDGSMHIDTTGPAGNLQLRIQQGRFEQPEKNYTVEDIDLTLLLPALPDLRSAPAQKILFSKASVGDLVFNNGKISWQLESPESIFIEESVVHWAGGRVFTNSIRLFPDMQDLSVPIFCDRLNLADLLKQFGVSNAAGEGTVNGRIPLVIGKKQLHIEDGFLYSSPGQGGSIKVAAFDMLSAGIPKNTPQFAQVDFAAEALKNFSYNWVKLLIDSQGEELVMQMQMDGEPVQTLPFRYDSKTGRLQRIQDDAGGIKQPIRLDVNFRLPLNRFLGYSGRIHDIMKQLK